MRAICLELLSDVPADEWQVEYLVDCEPVPGIFGEASSDYEFEVVVQVVAQRWVSLLDVLLQALHVIC